MVGRSLSNTLVILFFLFSLFYLLKNLVLSENNFKSLKTYKQSIRKLQNLLKNEEEKNRELKDFYEFVKRNEVFVLEIFARDYLWLIPKDEQVFLKKEKH